MKPLTVESAFRKKYNSFLGLSIGIPLTCLSFGCFPIREGSATYIATAFSVLGAVICVVFGIKSILLQVRLSKNRKIDSALREELLDYNDNKAYFFSYSFLMLALLAVAVLGLYFEIPVTKAAFGLWWAGVEIYFVLWLIFNR